MVARNDPVAVDEEWAYRARDSAPSERVRVVNIVWKKSTGRIDVEYLDGEKTGEQENVPAGRLRVPWAEVSEFDARMADWERIEDVTLDDTEQGCVEMVFDLLIPESVAEWEYTSVRDHVVIHDRDELSRYLTRSVVEILDQVEWFEDAGDIHAAPSATLMIAEDACRANPKPVLDYVVEKEREYREKCKRGSADTSPEYEWEWYLRYVRPGLELLRQWCGHRSVTFHARLTAAEEENRRLDILVAGLIDQLRTAGDSMADYYEEQHERDRILPHNVRPNVDRPLSIWEMPVVEVPRKRLWSR